VKLDGNGFRLDMLTERLRRDLPAVAEGAGSTGRPPEQRRRLANGVVDIITRYRGGLYDHREEGYLPTLRALRQRPLALAMYDLFPPTHEELWPRLEVTLDVLASWMLDEIAPEVVLEELHTAFELLLTRAARRSRAPMFFELVALADEKGWLGDVYSHPFLPLAVWDNPDDVLTERDLLISLKDQRKVTKHRGDACARDWLSIHFWPTAALLETVAKNIP
jgi:hypothetical protein